MEGVGGKYKDISSQGLALTASTQEPSNSSARPVTYEYSGSSSRCSSGKLLIRIYVHDMNVHYLNKNHR